MIISELIKQLEKQKEKLGDVPVVVKTQRWVAYKIEEFNHGYWSHSASLVICLGERVKEGEVF